MMKDTKKESVEQSELGLTLEELIGRGARALIEKAIEVVSFPRKFVCQG